MNYRDQTEHTYIEKKKQYLSQLPDYCTLFMNAKADKLEASTEANYAADFLTFFTWITQSIDKYIGMNTKDIPVECFEELTTYDIDAYLAYLTEYKSIDGSVRRNKNSAKSRKLSALKALCRYLNRVGLVKNNPTEYTETPKAIQKDIIVLSENEKKAIFTAIETGVGLDGKKLKGRSLTSSMHNRFRNKAIVTLLLGTGIRISELVGLDIDDIDFDQNVAFITRKGGKDDHVYFSNTVRAALEDYLVNGRILYNIPEDEKALFVSMKLKRLSVRSVEHMIHFYSDLALGKTDKRRITPHKFRSTFGTEAALKSHDLELTAALMGHKNVATTSKYYVTYSDSVKKEFIESLNSES